MKSTGYPEQLIIHSALGKMGERLNTARCVLSLRVREGESNHVTLKTMPKRAKQFKRVLF